jgi:predicted site-specific integrase-resolvase
MSDEFNNYEGFINEATLRELLPISRRTLHDWRSKGKIPFVRIPGTKRVLYHWKTIESALLRQQKGFV